MCRHRSCLLVLHAATLLLAHPSSVQGITCRVNIATSSTCRATAAAGTACACDAYLGLEVVGQHCCSCSFEPSGIFENIISPVAHVLASLLLACCEA
jgi:hypothetical protein